MKFILELSEDAEKDLKEIFEYTFSNFGLQKASDYVSSFDIIFNQLILLPNSGKSRTEIRMGLYSIAKEEHVVFYRKLDHTIRIVRILHASRDLPRHF